MFILIIFVYHTVQYLLLSLDTLSNKDAINALHKINHVISFNDICMQNAAWLRMVSEDRLVFPYFHKCVITHSPIDNNNGRQKTLTGPGTTQDTNKTIFSIFIYRREVKPTTEWRTRETTSSKR